MNLTSCKKFKNNKKVREWKDQSGRTISAEFVKSDNKTVTLIWNGKTTVLPLTMFSQESQEMASRLQKQKSPIPEIKQQVQKVDLNGELDLQREYPWQNSQNKTIVGRFIDLNDQNKFLTLTPDV